MTPCRSYATKMEIISKNKRQRYNIQYNIVLFHDKGKRLHYLKQTSYLYNGDVRYWILVTTNHVTIMNTNIICVYKCFSCSGIKSLISLLNMDRHNMGRQHLTSL